MVLVGEGTPEMHWQRRHQRAQEWEVLGEGEPRWGPSLAGDL